MNVREVSYIVDEQTKQSILRGIICNSDEQLLVKCRSRNLCNIDVSTYSMLVHGQLNCDSVLKR